MDSEPPTIPHALSLDQHQIFQNSFVGHRENESETQRLLGCKNVYKYRTLFSKNILKQ